MAISGNRPHRPGFSSSSHFRRRTALLSGFAALLALFILAGTQSAVAQREATFERTLTVNGSALQLSASTGSGNITLTRGSDNQVHIVGHVKAHWGADEDQVRQIAAHPPIEQTGNIVRIGGQHETWRNISIDYQIEAPANCFLNASSGSGNVSDDGVGESATLHTGSGNIRATGLKGGFSLGTGSGDIYGEQAGGGDVKATTGSGNIELRDINGGLTAHTGSGNIKLGGTPAAQWHVQTGSGNVSFWPSGKGFDLNASSGSGSIRSDRTIAMQGSLNRHHVTGPVNGGGSTVRISTGSGDIHIY